MSCIYVTVELSVDSQLEPHYVSVCIGLWRISKYNISYTNPVERQRTP